MLPTKRDLECFVDPKPLPCRHTWGVHGEHRCDSLDVSVCRVGSLRHHICWCGEEAYER